MPLDYAPHRRSGKEARHRASLLLERVGLSGRSDHEPSQMSGGQQQRVAIARSLVNHPSLVLVDEPTGNLDSHTSDEILRMFQELNKEGITVILVTHDSKVAAYAHRTIRIADGLIEDDQTHDPHRDEQPIFRAHFGWASVASSFVEGGNGAMVFTAATKIPLVTHDLKLAGYTRWAAGIVDGFSIERVSDGDGVAPHRIDGGDLAAKSTHWMDDAPSIVFGGDGVDTLAGWNSSPIEVEAGDTAVGSGVAASAILSVADEEQRGEDPAAAGAAQAKLFSGETESNSRWTDTGIAGGNHSGLAGGNHSGLAGGNHSGLVGGNHSGLAGGNHSGLAGGNHSGEVSGNHNGRANLNRTQEIPSGDAGPKSPAFLRLSLFPPTVCTAMGALRRNKMRSALTALGVIIGVGAVIAMTEIGEGSKIAIQRTIATMGANMVLVIPGAAMTGGVSSGAGTVQTLKPQDTMEILRQCPAVSDVAPFVWARTQLIYGRRNWVPQTMAGTTPSYFAVRDWEVEEGEAFTDHDVTIGSEVCLIGQTVKRELFQDESPVGKDIRVRNVTFKVIGVFSAKGANMWGSDQDDILVAPWTTIKFRVNSSGAASTTVLSTALIAASAVNTLNVLYPGGEPLYPSPSALEVADTPQPVRLINVDSILVKAASPDEIPEAISEIEGLLRERHHLPPDRDNDFDTRNMSKT